MSVLSKAPRPSGDDVRRVALAALAAALDEGTQQQQKAPKRKGGLKTGVRTVAAGAALYVAGRAAYNNRDAILEQLQDGREQDDDEPVAEEDEDYDEEEEPVAEEDEEYEDEDEEPVAEEDEDYEDDDEEPVAEEDEDYEDDDEEPVAEEDEDYDDDVDPVGRPPEPPEAEDDEEHAEADAEPARR
jgi:hypothetical protein